MLVTNLDEKSNDEQLVFMANQLSLPVSIAEKSYLSRTNYI